MCRVAIISLEQKITLTGLNYSENCFFNPIQDADNNWVVSSEEIEACGILWLKELPLVDFTPKTPKLL